MSQGSVSSTGDDGQFIAPGSNTKDTPSGAPVESGEVSDPQNLDAIQPAKDLPTPNFSDFLNRKNGKEVEPKEPVKPSETKPAEPADVKIELPKQEPVKQPKLKDFSGIEEADLPLFKDLSDRMSPKALDHMKKLYTENKNLTKQLAEVNTKIQPGQLPPSYYNNPEGYKLQKDYLEIEQQVQLASGFVNHWEQQLINIEDTGKWQNVTFDEKEQKWVIMPPQEATAADKIQVQRYIRQTAAQLQKVQSKQEAFVGGFAEKQKAAMAEVNELKNKWFNGWDKPDHPTAQLQKEYAKSLPAILKDSPSADFMTNGRILIDMQAARIKELEKALEVANGKKNITNNQPKRDEIPAGSSNGEKPAPTFSDFQNRLKGI